MNKHACLAMALGLAFCSPAFCQKEITVPMGPAIGVSMGQRSGDLSVGLDVTTPYLQFPTYNGRSESAIRLSGDMRLKEGVPLGAAKDSIELYYVARLGYVGGIRVTNFIRMYAEVGGMAVFPTAELSSSTNPHFGAYGHFGGEVFLGKNILNKNTCIYFEIGEEANGSGEARFDKLNNSPLMGTGPTACGGVRYYL